MATYTIERSRSGTFVDLGVTGRARHPNRRILRSESGRAAGVYDASPAQHDPALAHDLRAHVEGEVRFDGGSRALYATDASNYRQVPIGVVIPRSIEDVVATLQVCRAHGAPVLSRGGGTSLAGQCTNVAVVIDFSRYLNHVLEVDPARKAARVQPGCVLDDLRDAAERYNLTFGPDPATHDHNTLGGMLGNNSCGVHSVYAHRTSDNVRSLDIVTYDGLRMRVGPTSEDELRAIVAAGGRRGEIYRRLDELRRRYGDLIRERYPKIPRCVSGYNLDDLLPENGFHVARALVGSESTLVTILEAELDLVPSPPCRVLTVIGFKDVFEAADAIPKVLKHQPLACEGLDDMLTHYMRVKHLHEEDLKILPEGEGWLVVEFGGESRDEAAEKAQRLADDFQGQSDVCDVRIVREHSQQDKIWKVRESGLGATAYIPDEPDNWPGWEDSAVPPERLGGYLRDLKALFHKFGYKASVYGHFGDGLIHCRISFDLRSEEGVATWRRFMGEAGDLVVAYGGSLSGEHGDGEARAELLRKMYGPELLQAFREYKAIWDPEWRMNPGKVVDPFPITANLRLGPTYQPPKLETYFAYPHDHGSFAHAARRCVGVGKCRRHDSEDGVMCPSYMATREEKHSTRGRAHLLFEMLHGGPIARGDWRSDAVEDALDLCLACKGCKTDCPVNVDMATYKAEFRAHYYAGRLRPRAAYSMGLIWWWSRLASHMPHLANLAMHTPGLSALVKGAGGIAPERRMPGFAPVTFREWLSRRPPRHPDGPRVLLWPDTFTNHFRPETGIAATHVLEEMGFRVIMPEEPLCCGRPLYDWGWIEQAKRLWHRTLFTLRAEIEAGTPLVGLEPACTSAFKDELVNLFPEDPLARKLAEQSFFFSDFLERHQDRLSWPQVRRKALVQIHCHHHAVLETRPEKRVMDRLGLDHRVMPSGCCGMAGSFGFEAEKYGVSMTAAERVMLPMVRAAEPGTLIVADGFSCREQIEQATGRSTWHLADVVAAGLGWDVMGELRAAGHRRGMTPVESLALLTAAAGAGAALGSIRNGRHHARA